MELPEEIHKDFSAHTDTLQVQDVYESYFEYEKGCSDIFVKDRLKNSVNFWKSINASSFIVDIIENGYKIPLLKEPENMFSKNNKSALEHSDFVSSAIKELVSGGLVKRVSIMPHVVNPLTVSVNGKGKHRLIFRFQTCK